MVLFSPPPFQDRRDAGRQLAEALMHLKNEKPVVLALPRGGVPVGYEVARALDAPLDVLLVRKIGAPGQPELGLGAVVDGQRRRRVLNEEVIKMVQPPEGYIEAEEQRQFREIERRRALYCGTRMPMPVEGRTVIVVDDGIATGGTMKTALAALSGVGLKRLILAVPVAPREVLDSLCTEVDESVCLLAPQSFRAVSPYYADFDQTKDEEVIELLDLASLELDPDSDNQDPAKSDTKMTTEAPGALRHPPANPPGGRF